MLRIEPRLAFINGVLLANRVLIFRFQLLAVYVLLEHNCGECRIEAAPGLFDIFKSAKCDPIPANTNTCAIVYDDQDCAKGDWTPVKISPGQSISFSILTRNPLKALKNLFNYKNDIESLVVRKGCTLEVFKDSDYSGGKYTFVAPPNADLIWRELEDSVADDFGKFWND
jgi:hypothetical protein